MRFRVRAIALPLTLLMTITAGATSVAASTPASTPALAPLPDLAPIVAAVPVAVPVAIPLTVRAAERPALLLAVALEAAAALKVRQLRARVVKVARNQIGDRYSAGAMGPGSFDCSGLTRYVFKVATGKTLPHQSRAQYAKVKRIRFKDAQPGDLVFFFRNGAHHVGVYIGNRRMIDAVGYGKGVRISPISGSWWSRSYSGMGRILPA